MLRRLGLALVVLLMACGYALAQPINRLCVQTAAGGCVVVSAGAPLPITGSFTAAAFLPGPAYAVPLSVTSTSSSVSLPAGTTVVLYNTGAVAAFCKLGSGATTATTSNDQVSPGGFFSFAVGSFNTVACITTDGATTVNVSGGTGTPSGSGGGGGSSGSGGLVDEGAFVGGTTLFSLTGGFYQTTATSNPLTTGQYGAFQTTANRALFTNLRNAAGAEVGVAAVPLQVTGANGTFPVTNTGTFATQAAQSGTWNIGTVTTVTTVSASRTVGNAGGAMDAAGQNASSPANSLLVAGQFNTTPTTISSGNMSPLQLDNAGNLLVNIKTGASSGAVAQGSTTAGQTGLLVQCAVTTAAPTYTTAQTDPLSCGTDGALRVNVTSALGLAQGSTTSGQTGSMIMGAVTTAPPSYTTAQTAYMSLATNGAMRITGSGVAGTPDAVGGVLTIQGIASMTKLLVTPDSVALPANQSVNVAQVAGTATDTNSGVKSAGTVRMVLATDQPQLTNKLLVTPDANSAVNVAQINGVTVLMGNGNTGTGSQRVTIAADNSPVAGMGVGATAAAPPANSVYLSGNASGATGGLLKGLITCDLHAKYDASDTGSITIVTGVSGRKVYICGYIMATGATATTLKLREGSDANCATNGADITPGYLLVANDKIGIMSAFWTGLAVSTNAYFVCVNASAANAHQAEVWYTIL